jgi:autotransporter-associated beta strand protein
LNSVYLDSSNGTAATVDTTIGNGAPRFGYYADGLIESTGVVADVWNGGLVVANGSSHTLTFAVTAPLSVTGAIRDLSGYTGTPVYKTGIGTLSLSGLSTYAGPTIVNGGTLRIPAGGSLYYGAYAGDSLSVTVNSGGTLDLATWGQNTTSSGTVQSLGGLTKYAVGIILNGGAISMSNTAPTVSERGFTIQSGGASLIANGAALWTLTDTSGWTIANTAGGPLTLAGSGNAQLDKVISGTGGMLTKSGSGAWTLSRANTYTGGTTISGGVLNINADAALGAVPSSPATNVTFSKSGVLQAAAGMTLSANRGIVISNGASGGFDTNGNAVNIAGYAVVQASAGRLRFNSTSASSVGVGATATVAVGATLELDGVNSELTDATNVIHRASVSNNGMLAVGNTAITANTTQQVGGIDGSGDVTVSDDAHLTANHIIQTSLVVGASATFTLAPSAADGSPMADGLVLAGSLAPSSSIVASGGSVLAAGDASTPSLPASLGGTGSTDASAVPEPSTAVLILLGSAAFLFTRRQ